MYTIQVANWGNIASGTFLPTILDIDNICTQKTQLDNWVHGAWSMVQYSKPYHSSMQIWLVSNKFGCRQPRFWLWSGYDPKLWFKLQDLSKLVLVGKYIIELQGNCPLKRKVWLLWVPHHDKNVSKSLYIVVASNACHILGREKHVL